ncbi:ead/Ea22-like family protein [Raoultella ornithinolytica]|uniref:ead/Ea22-like family protein n=1 Tax=Raoultella ornithinolytica TaxID=54291 RepID=UPI002350358C|nr:ead/Ea22-like family protein [Raoultella ornithinolytica]MDC7941344.1 ead/Ea22-like family protein [Raoultella ornithinolytica]
MTDITELATAMKAAAMKATPGQWVAFTHTDSRTFSVHTPDDKRCGDVIKWAGFDGQRKAKANAEFIALANPANVITLVEALEKAQAKNALVAGGIEAAAKLHERIAELDAELEREREKSRRVMSRIAELESRTVKLPKRSVGEVMHMSGFSRDYAEGWCSGNDNAIHEMRVAGIKWETE